MFFHWARHTWTGLLFVCSFSVLAFSFIIASLGAMAYALRRRFGAREGSGELDMQRRWAADEFQFEGAIGVYEELIDANTRRRR